MICLYAYGSTGIPDPASIPGARPGGGHSPGSPDLLESPGA